MYFILIKSINRTVQTIIKLTISGGACRSGLCAIVATSKKNTMNSTDPERILQSNFQDKKKLLFFIRKTAIEILGK